MRSLWTRCFRTHSFLARHLGGARLACSLAGAITPLSLAPFDFWPAAIIGCVLLALCLRDCDGRKAFWHSWFFGFGLFAVGASWVYVSIQVHGQAPVPLALFLTFLWSAGLALVFATPFYFYGRFFSHNRWQLLIAFPAFWLLGEWLRNWLLTGFPWLYLGYGHTETWLAGLAPVTGVYGISLVVVFTAATIASVIHHRALLVGGGLGKILIARKAVKFITAPSAIVVFLWVGALLLTPIQWTQQTGEAIRVGAVQPSIPQQIKWHPAYRQPTLDRYQAMTSQLWQQDLIIWPESAIPLLYHQAQPFLKTMAEQATASGTGIIFGILYDDKDKQAIYNSVAGMGEASGIYHKQRLVPFGEYVPLEKILRGLIQFFDLPMSRLRAGENTSDTLSFRGLAIAPYICYEIVYPDLVAESAIDADILLTISNDAWFGRSIGPLQHFQMAQMRAMESQKFLIRSTNNGLTAIIHPDGKMGTNIPQFSTANLAGEVYASNGSTPFSRIGSAPIIVFCFLLLSIVWLRRQ